MGRTGPSETGLAGGSDVAVEAVGLGVAGAEDAVLLVRERVQVHAQRRRHGVHLLPQPAGGPLPFAFVAAGFAAINASNSA